jgi:3-hydroxy-9,10-secoandrosta-1,3,5(10)-triene-9,17-dione monooxygenase
MPSATQLIEAARALGPDLIAASADTDARRDVAPGIVDKMRQSRMFDVLKPAQWGGLALDPANYFEIQNVLAEHCLSTAWIFGVLNVQSLFLALFDARAQADVWAGPNPGLVCSSFRPGGTAERDGDGYRLRGQWPFSSGSSHCRWALVGAMSAPESGDGPPAMRLFLVPRDDYEIVDTWHTFGLRGTASNDLKIDGAWVPTYRSLVSGGGLTVVSAEERPGPALYRLPWLYVFGGSISNLAIGGGRRAINAFRKAGAARVNAPGTTAQAADQIRAAIALAHTEVEAMDIMIKRHCAAMMSCAEAGLAMPLGEALLYRSQLAGVVGRITAQVDRLMILLGARGINEDGPLTRTWLDLCAMRHHPGNSADTVRNLLGAELLGGNPVYALPTGGRVASDK